MIRRSSKKRNTGKLGLWPLVLTLVVAVSVPTTCVVWFMSRAVENEQLAVRQSLSDAYKGLLARTARRLDEFWSVRAEALRPANGAETASETFARLVVDGITDSAVIRDDSGRVLYPIQPVPGPSEPDSIGWEMASNLEHTGADPTAAASAYALVVQSASDPHLAARAIQAQARCLLQSGDRNAAIRLLSDACADPRLRSARTTDGRSFLPSAQLVVLELSGDPSSHRYQKTLQDLRHALLDYRRHEMPSRQRLFLMERVNALDPSGSTFPTRDAERLAAEYLAAEPSFPVHSGVQPTPLPRIFRLISPDKTIVALLSEDHLRRDIQSVIDSEISSHEMVAEVFPPGTKPSDLAGAFKGEAGMSLPGWSLTLDFPGVDPYSIAAGRRKAVYLFAGSVSIVLTLITAALVFRLASAQIRLAKVKNDLVSTVSHELKTPLASVRAVIDSVLEGRIQNEQELAEYLQIASTEAERLSRLIDNFLTFSRIEGNRQAFAQEEVEIGRVVKEVSDSIRRRFVDERHVLEVDVDPNLPMVAGDARALATVLDNLLDNAYKYSGEEKRVVLRAYADNGSVCLEVEDNGIGLSRADLKKMFDRFYQADQTSTRSRTGCGLGLSIAKSIVDAHGGEIIAESEPDRGAVFKVFLPVASCARDNGESEN